MDEMTVLIETGAPELADLRELTPEQLALEAETAGIIARLVRADEANGDGSEAVRVAAFNSFI
jgi:hypothetical protein